MARIKGIELPNNKRIEISLTYIYGIGRKLSNKISTYSTWQPPLRSFGNETSLFFVVFS